MYLNHRVYDSILTEDKNSTRKGSRENREVQPLSEQTFEGNFSNPTSEYNNI
jgi:hypothetical protein